MLPRPPLPIVAVAVDFAEVFPYFNVVAKAVNCSCHVLAITVAVRCNHVEVITVGTAGNRVAVERYSCVTAVENNIQIKVNVQQKGKPVVHVRNENALIDTFLALGHFPALSLYVERASQSCQQSWVGCEDLELLIGLTPRKSQR